jgi:hypothetical protein
MWRPRDPCWQRSICRRMRLRAESDISLLLALPYPTFQSHGYAGVAPGYLWVITWVATWIWLQQVT